MSEDKARLKEAIRRYCEKAHPDISRCDCFQGLRLRAAEILMKGVRAHELEGFLANVAALKEIMEEESCLKR